MPNDVLDLQAQLIAYLNQAKPHDWYQRYMATRKRPKSGRRRKLGRLQDHPALQLPSYWFFERARRVSPQAWLIHCSVRQFKQFRRGTHLSTLHLSTWVSSVLAPKNNLKLPIEEAVFGFAYDLRMPTAIEDCGFYSPEGYIFRSDQAVRTHHAFDQGGDQVIFPIGSEKDLIRVKSVFGKEKFQNGRWTNQPGILIRLPNGTERLFDSRRELLTFLNTLPERNPVYYHGTRQEHLPSIQKNGLCYPFLSSEPEEAWCWGRNYSNQNGRDVEIFEVDLDDEDLDYLVPDYNLMDPRMRAEALGIEPDDYFDVRSDFIHGKDYLLEGARRLGINSVDDMECGGEASIYLGDIPFSKLRRVGRDGEPLD